ncbi:MAG: hypothetical protein Kow0037_09840 [Calditrichia bacterium]
MKNKKKKIITALLVLLLLTPLWMWIAWLLQEKSPFKLVIIDKTVLNTEAREHRSINWILNHLKLVKADSSFYEIEKDYYGFFPKPQKKFEIHDFKNWPDEKLTRLADSCDAIYVADTYGIYTNEWYLEKWETERSRLIYGGMQQNELELLKKFKDRRKLIVMEFNSIALPTSRRIRTAVDTLFGVQWSGWVGRYFDLLDTLKNPELPRWVYRNYKAQHGNRWPFKSGGIVLVRWDDTIEILDADRDLEEEIPVIYATPQLRKEYGTVSEIKCAYWFDIVSNTGDNEVLANYQIHTNSRGDSILRRYKIPTSFPAVLRHTDGYRFYYFAGDFADNPIRMSYAHYRGVEYFDFLFYTTAPLDRRWFFWGFYRPLVQTIFSWEKNYLRNGKKYYTDRSLMFKTRLALLSAFTGL